MYKRTRARRNRRRRRRPLRRSKKLARTVTSAIRREVYKAKEGKCVTGELFLTNVGETTPTYVNEILYLEVYNGTTDRGRIGNTIHATGIRVNYVFTYKFPNNGDLFSTEPMILHMVLIQVKNPWVLPHTHWFKSFDRGANEPTVPLERTFIDDGRRVFNTDQYTVLKHKTVSLQPTDDRPATSTTGYFTHNMKRTEIKFDSNGNTNSIADLNKIYMFYAYVYTGTGFEVVTPAQYGARFAIYQYYKD